ncbi:MAG TPA: class I SAM-dependent methyltransferase [Pseudomonadales bacterium]|nr:class I SAM-dependent methyltransferase [Pseudomonadales bacterium]
MSRFRLEYSADGYTLAERDSGRTLHIDYASARLKHRIRGGRELLARAAKAKPGVSVLDATAGLGIDSFILASRGCMVQMVERSATLHLMLEDALLRASQDRTTADIAGRMTLVRGDAHYVMAHLDSPPDVIVIDPMFPPRRKSAAVRGELQLLQEFLGKDEHARSLVVAARNTGAARIVVKRPLTGGDLAGLTPSHSVRGRASRWDVFAGR